MAHKDPPGLNSYCWSDVIPVNTPLAHWAPAHWPFSSSSNMPWKAPPQGLCTHQQLLLFPLTSFMSLLKCSFLMKYMLIVQFKMETKTKTKTLLAFPIPFPCFDLFLLDRLLTYHVIGLLFIFGLLQLTCEVLKEGVFSCFA